MVAKASEATLVVLVFGDIDYNNEECHFLCSTTCLGQMYTYVMITSMCI